MADSSDRLEILIKLLAETHGADQVQAALNKTKDEAANMGKKMEEAGEAGKKAAEGMFDKHRELRELISSMANTALPGFGRAFGALALGPMGAVIAISTAVEILHGIIEKTTQQTDALAQNTAKAFGGSDSLTDYVQAAMQAATAASDLAAALHKAADAGPEIKNRYDEEAKAIQATADALKERLHTQELSDLADARKRKASPEEIDTIRARYESRSSAVQDAAAQALIAAQVRELAERKGRDQSLKDAAAASLTPESVLQQRKGRADELTAQEAALAKATSDVNTVANDELKEKIESNKQALEFARNAVGAGHDPLGLKKQMEDETARMESETAEARIERAKERIKELSGQVMKDQDNATKEKSAAQEAEDAATENAKRIVELQKEITQANKSAQIKAESTAQLIRSLNGDDVRGLERTAGVDTGAGAAAFIQQFLAAQKRLGSHTGTAADSQLVSLLNELLKSTRQSDQTTYLLLQDLINHKGDLNAALQQLAEQTGRQISNLKWAAWRAQQ